MSDTVTFEDRGQFVYCRYTGPFELDPLVDASKEVSVFCKSQEYSAVLVDISESFGDLGDFMRFKHGATASEFVSKDLKIALLARSDQFRDRFWENVTRNRSLQTKVFTDLEMAEKWVLS